MLNPVEYFFQISIPYTFANFAPDRTQFVFMSVALLICIGVLVFHKHINWKRWVYAIICLEYLFLLLYVTVIGRTTTDDYLIELTPLWSYQTTGEKVPNIILEVLLNVVLFLPLGMFLASCKRLSFRKVLVHGIAISVIIEFTQLVTHRGLCETDDVIHNTLGCILGYGLYHMINRIVKLFKK